MDFIERLPCSRGKSVILIAVNHLTKYGHFLELAHPFITATVAQEFLNSVCKLHSMLDSIISERDRVFVSNF